MEQDHYAVLGISPTVDQAAVRLAYRALMRRYHPDADSSDEAATQARAINLAYATLGDPVLRTAYDSSLGIKSPLKFEPAQPRIKKKAWPARLGTAAAIGVALVAAGMVAYAVIPHSNGHSERVQARTAQKVTRVAPSFRAADPRPNLPKPVATQSSAKAPETENLDPRPREAGGVLPKNAAIVPAKGNRGDVAGAAPEVSATSSKCAAITRRADRMVCNDENLSSLDRQLSLLYRQSWAAADERKRTALVGTRQIFNDRRDDCETPNCLTSTYVIRLKEISDIMAGRPPRQ